VTGVDINRRRISQQSVREIGTHEVAIRLGTEISPYIKVTVVRDDELTEFLAKRDAKAKGEEVEASEAEAVEDVVAEVESVEETVAGNVEEETVDETEAEIDETE
jgi:hypothetical protein